LLQPAAKERQRDAGEKFGKGAKLSLEIGEAISAPAEQRKVAAQAVGASTRSVEKAARVERSAPDLLPQVQAGTMALHMRQW